MPSHEPERKLLTNLELEVMQVVWQGGGQELTVREVVDTLNAGRKRPLAYNTVQTMLTILREKGAVEVQRRGRAHAFRPRLSREQVTTHMVGDLVDRLFGGEVNTLLQHLMEREILSADELRELRTRVQEQLDDAEDAP